MRRLGRTQILASPALVPLFISQRSYGIDAGRAPGWNEAGQDRNSGEGQHHAGDGQGVCGRDAVEQSGQQASRSERSDQAATEANNDGSHCLPQDHLQNVSAAGSEGHADTHFIGAQGNRIRDDAVDAEAGQHQGGHCKKQDQTHLEAPLS